MTRVNWSRLRQILRRFGGSALVVVGLAAMIGVLLQTWEQAAPRMRGMDLRTSAVSTLCAIGMMACSALAFAVLAQPNDLRLASIRTTAGVYLLAQPLKYLPGRVWSIAFQLARVAEQVGMLGALAATLTHLFVTTVTSLLLFDAAVQSRWSILLAGASVIAIWLWRGGVQRYFSPSTCLNRSFLHLASTSVAILGEWLLFLAVSWLICNAMSGSEVDFLLVTALYAVSWLFGSLVAFAPGGIGIREGGFVALALISGIPADIAASFAVIARLIFVVAEVGGACAALVCLRVSRRSRS